MPEPPDRVVLLHGVGEGPDAWRPFAESASTTLPDLPIDVPWLRGLEPGTDERFTLAGASEQVLGYDGPLALVGGSLGAVVALDVAVRAPSRVAGLVLAAGQVHPPAGLMKAQRLVFATMPERVVRRMGVEKDRLLAALDAAARIDHRSALVDIASPTLVLVGARDRANRPAAEQLAAGIPDAGLVVVPGAGHRIHADAPDAFAGVVLPFLASLFPGG